jgi:hypothetical protein
MLTRLICLTVLFPAAVVISGCRLGSLSFRYHDDDHHGHGRARVTHVYAETGHVCSHGCHDHYWDGGRVVVVSGHRHGPGCGHHWSGSHWLVVRKGKAKRVYHDGHQGVVKVRHVHGPSCGCAYHGHHRKWVKVRTGHVHGPGCGHLYIEGRWTIRY